MNPKSKRYAINTSWLLSDRALRLLSSVFINIWLARHFGPDVFGSFVYCLAIIAILGPFLQMGLRAPLTKHLSNASANARGELIDTALSMRLLITGLLFALSLIYSVAFRQSIAEEQIFLPLLFAAQILFSAEVFAIRFDSIIESKTAIRASIAQSIVAILLKGSLILLDVPIAYFFGAIFLEYLVYASTLTSLYSKRFERPTLNFSKKTAKSLLKDSFPIIISGFSIMIYMKIDVIMLKRIAGSETAGTYAAAASLSECWYFLPTTISQALLPAILKAKEKGEASYRRALAKLSSSLIWLSLSIAVATTFLGQFAVPLLFGNAYSEAVAPLKIHIWAGVFASIGVANSGWFIAEGKQRLAAAFAAAGAISNIVLNYLLIPTMGSLGAAWATLFAYAIAGYILLPLTSATRARFTQISLSLFRYSRT